MDEQEEQQGCIFCSLASGKIPSKKVYEDDACVGILDINPAVSGHVLLLPKNHYQILPQVSDQDLVKLFNASKLISNAMLKALKVEGTNVFIANGVVAGQRAPHVIVHIIPRISGDGLDILKIPEQSIPEEQLNESGKVILEMLQKKLGGEKR